MCRKKVLTGIIFVVSSISFAPTSLSRPAPYSVFISGDGSSQTCSVAEDEALRERESRVAAEQIECQEAGGSVLEWGDYCSNCDVICIPAGPGRQICHSSVTCYTNVDCQ